MNGFCKSFLLFLIISLMMALRLPAPVIEETSATPTVQPKPKPPAVEHKQPPPQKKSISPFAGTWEGAATFTCSDGYIGKWPSVLLVFPSDAQTVRTRWVTGSGEIGGPFVTVCAVNGGIARWNFTSISNDSQTSFTDSVSMRLVDPRTAAVSLRIVYTSGDSKGTSCDVTTTLIRQ